MTTPPNPPSYSRWRRRLYRLAAATLVPALFFGALELTLRMCGFGDPTAFFLDGGDFGAPGLLVENRVYGRRFFPLSLRRVPGPLQLAMPATKPAGTFRIFVLGESAAQGFPEPTSSFARVLEVMLRERYPRTHFEVINTAMVAINSHVVLSIAQECAGHEPDLFVMLMGNNEVVGPFGAAGVLGGYAPNRRLIRANLAVKTTRIGQLVNRLVQGSGAGPDQPLEWKGMATFTGSQVRADNPALAGLYDHFRANLQDICSTAQAAGVPIVVCTVPVNLRDWPPFASAHDPNLEDERLRSWEAHFHEGSKHEAACRFGDAMRSYQHGAAIDATYAELAYRTGRCELAMGHSDAARQQFISSRDLDALRFRCDSTLNDIIRRECADRVDEGIRLVDAEKAFAADSNVGIPGSESFLEHVHLNFHGRYLLARSVFDAIHDLLPAAAPPLTEAECADRLAWTVWNEGALATDLRLNVLGQPPFTNQLDHEARLKQWDARIKELGEETKAAGLPRIIAVYEDAIRRAEGDWMIRMNFGRLLTACGEPQKAIEQYEAALRTLPHNFPALEQIGKLHLKLGRQGEAMAAFRAALALNPDFAEAHLGLAEALAAEGEIDQALAACAVPLAVPEDRPKALMLAATLLLHAGRTDEARARFTELVRLRPNETLAHLRLGDLDARAGNTDAAIAHYEAALRLQPDMPELAAHIERLRKK